MAPGMSDQHILYKNNGKPTMDVNFIKWMAKTIKANQASKLKLTLLMKRTEGMPALHWVLHF
jgi:hypothetical protein